MMKVTPKEEWEMSFGARQKGRLKRRVKDSINRDIDTVGEAGEETGDRRHWGTGTQLERQGGTGTQLER